MRSGPFHMEIYTFESKEVNQIRPISYGNIHTFETKEDKEVNKIRPISYGNLYTYANLKVLMY